MTNTLSGSGSFSGVGSLSAPSNAVSYTLGQTGPGGGKIFYVAPTGTTFAGGPTLNLACTYLEASPITGTNAFADNYNNAPIVRKYSAVASLMGGTGTAIGTGYQNTLLMVTVDSSAEFAAPRSRAYAGPNNLSDWFLPSKDELNELWSQKTMLGGFEAYYYWSSSEFNSGTAWTQIFGGDASQYNSGKHAEYYYRPIRAF